MIKAMFVLVWIGFFIFGLIAIISVYDAGKHVIVIKLSFLGFWALICIDNVIKTILA